MATVSDGWRSASGCNGGHCIEVQASPGDGRLVAIRNSNMLLSTAVICSREDWAVFVAGVKAGEFDDLTEAP